MAPWADLALEQPPDMWTLPLVALAAVLADLSVRSGIAALSGTLLVLAVGAGLLASRRATSVHGQVLIAATPLFGLFLSLRMSAWLIPFDVMAIGSLLVMGVALARAGSALDLTVPSALARASHAAERPRTYRMPALELWSFQSASPGLQPLSSSTRMWSPAVSSESTTLKGSRPA